MSTSKKALEASTAGANCQKPERYTRVTRQSARAATPTVAAGHLPMGPGWAKACAKATAGTKAKVAAKAMAVAKANAGSKAKSRTKASQTTAATKCKQRSQEKEPVEPVPDSLFLAAQVAQEVPGPVTLKDRQ